MALPNIAHYRESTPSLASKWNIASADAAISAHEQGNFNGSARMVDAMGRDDRIDGVLGTRIQAVLGLPQALVPPVGQEKNTRAKLIAEELGIPWANLANEDTLAEALKWKIMLGFWVGELIWYDAAGKLQSDPQRLKIWHPQHIRHDLETGRYLVNTRDQGEIPVTHGDGKWIIGAGKSPRPWMRGAVRSLWILWLGRQFDWRDFFLYGERTGQGVLAAKRSASDDTSQLITALRSVWRGVIADLPQEGENGANADIDLLETDGGPDTFEKILDKIDTAIAVRLLGQNLTTEVSGGSFAATRAHERVRQDYLEADTDGLANDTQSGIFAPWVDRRYGARELAPYPAYNASEPEDVKVTAEGQKAFGEAVKAVQDAGFDVENVDALAEKHGLKLKKRPEPKAPPALAAVPKSGAQEPPPKAAARLSRGTDEVLRLASGDRSASGFLDGQLYSDAIVEHLTRLAREDIDETIEAVREELDAATDYEDLRVRLRARYEHLSPERLSERIELASLMANLAGRAAVNQDA
jgi:phage gp29-like protein